MSVSTVCSRLLGTKQLALPCLSFVNCQPIAEALRKLLLPHMFRVSYCCSGVSFAQACAQACPHRMARNDKFMAQLKWMRLYRWSLSCSFIVFFVTSIKSLEQEELGIEPIGTNLRSWMYHVPTALLPVQPMTTGSYCCSSSVSYTYLHGDPGYLIIKLDHPQ